MTFSTHTSSTSVEHLVLSFFLHVIPIIEPHPRKDVSPMCPHQLPYMERDSYMHHFIELRIYGLSISGK